MSWNMKVSYCKSNDTWMVCAYKPRKGNQINEVKYIAGRHSRAELKQSRTSTNYGGVKNEHQVRMECTCT